MQRLMGYGYYNGGEFVQALQAPVPTNPFSPAVQSMPSFDFEIKAPKMPGEGTESDFSENDAFDWTPRYLLAD